MKIPSPQEITHFIQFSQSFTYQSKLIFVLDAERRINIINAIDKLILRLFSGNIEQSPITKKEKKEIQELLLLKECLKEPL